MGMLIDGKWSTEWYKADSEGRFIRPEAQFRNWITADGSSGFKAEADRYHLYVSLACPWAHRTLIMRKLKQLENVISISVVDPFMGEDGWFFSDAPGCTPDTVNQASFLHEIYTRARTDYSGRVTVPVLWDKETRTIVNNESSEIMRMLDLEFDALGNPAVNFYPETHRNEIDHVCKAIYEPVNNGVYRTGFATTQRAYDEAVTQLFEALDYWEGILSKQRYLCGSVITEADWRLFTTLIRFDPVYVGHFKCNLKRIADYANLWNYLKELYQIPGVAETCDFNHIKRHYYASHTMINPTGIVPKGPIMNLYGTHDRDRFAENSGRTALTYNHAGKL